MTKSVRHQMKFQYELVAELSPCCNSAMARHKKTGQLVCINCYQKVEPDRPAQAGKEGKMLSDTNEISTIEACRRQLQNIVYCCDNCPDLIDSIRTYAQTALDKIARDSAAGTPPQDATERKDCLKALETLSAVGYPTPQEGYGTNSSWAISDLCRALAASRSGAAPKHSEDCAIHGCEGWNGPRHCDCGVAPEDKGDKE